MKYNYQICPVKMNDMEINSLQKIKTPVRIKPIIKMSRVSSPVFKLVMANIFLLTLNILAYPYGGIIASKILVVTLILEAVVILHFVQNIQLNNTKY